ncbi:HutD/Ves family protein [Phyllobacterium leguminum]|uniref:HutD/Ves family protein n=1 Tax=Phyllobacterium leguminum TaxID=314237 RepID=UPI000DA20C91|nr:HutD family protein [Phyllobacterium leguminum]
MTLLRAADHRRMPWKNGGGETTEIAVFPPHAGLSDFDWRISMAKVASDGPFSIFPEIDRTLCILDGNGLGLSIEGQGCIHLNTPSAPLSFPADIPVHARLTDGPITDLNVMTRRGRFTHTVRRVDVEHPMTMPVRGTPAVILCHHGAIRLDDETQAAQLASLDCLLIDNAVEKPLRLSGPGRIFVIEIFQGP